MTYTTKIEKGFHGLTAITEIPLNVTTEEGAMVLRVTSSKRHSGSVSTNASIVYYKPDGCYSMILFQDYSKTIASGKIARVTEKNLGEFHARALEAVPAALSEVNTQYNLAA